MKGLGYLGRPSLALASPSHRACSGRQPSGQSAVAKGEELGNQTPGSWSNPEPCYFFFFFPVNLFFKEQGIVSLNMGRKRRELVLFSWVFAGLMALAVSGPTPQEARWIAWNKMGSDP